MAAKKTGKKPAKANKETTKTDNTKKHRQDLRRLALKMAKAEADNLAIRRNYDEVDPYENLNIQGIVDPPYDFTDLMTVVENSDILQACASAMNQNVHGFGYELAYKGDDTKPKPPADLAEEIRAKNFFDQVNPEQSFQTARAEFGKDFEYLGCGAFEVFRNREGNVSMLYPLPIKNMRKTVRDDEAVQIKQYLIRDGKKIPVRIWKRFKRFVLIYDNTTEYRFFKEFGDTRNLCAITGEWKDSPEECERIATEVVWIENKFPGYHYGLPRWFGALLDVLGRSDAQYVNRTLLSAGGTPKLIIAISGGTLTEQSWEDLKEILQSNRGLLNYHEPLILESSADSLDLNSSSGSTKIEVMDWTKFREKDVMFKEYLKTTKETVRNIYRFPPVYIGDLGSYSFASLYASRESGEEQVFIPERRWFDELINTLIMPELPVDNWAFKSKGPQIRGSEETRKAIDVFSRAGALTVNHAIRMANEAFGLNMSQFDAPWARYPIPMVLTLIEKGQLAGVEEIMAKVEETAPPPAISEDLIPEKIAKSDAFSEDQKNLYGYLRGLMLLMGDEEEDGDE